MGMLVSAGGIGGLLSGAAMGAMVSPHPGILLGAIFGLVVGVCAGKAMQNEEQRKSARDRALDDIIGVTSGNLGTRRRVPPLPSEEILREAANRRWVAEWLTPVTPRVAKHVPDYR